MKKLLSAIFLCIFVASFFSLSALANTVSHTVDEITLKISDKYFVFTPNSTVKDFAALKGSDKLKDAFANDNELVFIATTDGLQSQFVVRKTQTEFSKKTESLNGISEEMLKNIAAEITDLPYEGVYTTGNVNYLRFDNKSEAISTTLFVAIENGNLYTFNYYGNDVFVSAELLNGVTIQTKKEISSVSVKTVVIIVIVWLVIAAVAIFLIYLVISFIRDYKISHNENDVSNYIKIKRRKF